MAKRVEVFTAGSYLCEGVVKQVKNLACQKCEVIVYDLNRKTSTIEWEEKAQVYGVQSIPAVAIDGKIIDHALLKGTN